MKFFKTFLILIGLSASFCDAAPKSFSDPRMAIEEAKKDGKLIIFLLVDSFSKEGKAVEEAVLDQIKNHDKEFVIARCNNGSQTHRAIFTDRFKKDVSRAPVAVVSNAAGEEVTGCYGVKPEIYRKMISISLIKGGFVKDKKEIIALRKNIMEDADEDELVTSIFGIKKSDLQTQVEMTDLRTWTYKNGKTFIGALVEGKGTFGLFSNELGEKREVPFSDLSEKDLEFLATILTVKEAETKPE